MDDDDDNSSRNSSVSSSTRSNTSGSDDEARERDEHRSQANRRQRVLYNDLLHERCFGKMDFDQGNVKNLSDPLSGPSGVGSSAASKHQNNSKVSKVQGKKKNLWKSSSILRYRKRLSKQSSVINDENDVFQMQKMGGIGKLLRGNQNEFDIKLQ